MSMRLLGNATTARLRRLLVPAALTALAVLALGPATAPGAFPGTNGLIAFEGANAGNRPTLFTVNPDGTGLVDLLQADFEENEWWNDGRGAADYNPSWAPDGSRLVFDATAGGFNPVASQCSNDALAIWEYVLSSGEIAPVVCYGQAFPGPSPLHWYFPNQLSWSPDGSQLVIEAPDDMEGDVWLLDLATSSWSVVYDAEIDSCTWEAPAGPAWSPDGELIAFSLYRQESCPTITDRVGLYTIAPDGSGLTRLTVDDPEHPSVRPDWSPDGSKIVYLRADNYSWQADRGSAVYVLDVATGVSTLLTDVGLSNKPVWSPDGTKIAFANNRDGDFDIYVMDADGSDVTQVTNLPGNEQNPSWQRLLAPPDPDADGDGVDDSIDTGAGAFDDGAGTAGSIVDAAGLSVRVADADEAGDGVKITVGPGTGRATLTVCGFTVRVAAGSEVVVSCGSVTVEVVAGSAEVVLGGGTVVVSVPEGGSARVTDAGGTMFDVDNLGSTAVTVTVDGTPTSVPAGGSATTSTDVTAPTIAGAATPAPDGQDGWNLGDVTVTFTCEDGESGIETCTPPVTLTAEGGGQSALGTAVDNAGNSTSTAVSGIKIDKSAPTVACTPASFVVNQPGAQVTATVTDAVSGPVAGTVAAAVATTSAGTFSVPLTGADRAGRTRTVGCSYTVGYQFTGLLAPIDNPPTVNRANAGQTIPVRWRLTDHAGVGISDPASFVALTSTVAACTAGAPVDAVETYAGSSGLQYLGDGYWQYSWKTPRTYAGQCRTLRLNLADGVDGRVAAFTFK